MTHELKITATDGSGTFSAYVAYPEIDPAPVVIVIQEIFGVNKNLRDICLKLANEGYIGVCPDLFWRQQPGIQLTDQTEAEWKRAFELFNGFNIDKGIEDLKATLALVRTLPEATGKAGTMGYCLGGKLAFLMATRSDADSNISYYGVGIDALLGEKDNIKKPLLMHIAENDGFSSPEKREKIMTALKDNKNVTMYTYPGMDHAFTRIGGKNYNKEAAEQAYERTEYFLAKSL
jgi:carboxymethylenebutenolidase